MLFNQIQFMRQLQREIMDLSNRPTVSVGRLEAYGAVIIPFFTFSLTSWETSDSKPG